MRLQGSSTGSLEPPVLSICLLKGQVTLSQHALWSVTTHTHTHILRQALKEFIYTARDKHCFARKAINFSTFWLQIFSKFKSEMTLSTTRVRPETDGYILDEFANATTGLSVHTRTYHRLLTWTMNQKRSWFQVQSTTKIQYSSSSRRPTWEGLLME